MTTSWTEQPDGTFAAPSNLPVMSAAFAQHQPDEFGQWQPAPADSQNPYPADDGSWVASSGGVTVDEPDWSTAATAAAAMKGLAAMAQAGLDLIGSDYGAYLTANYPPPDLGSLIGP
jgi:hypothetical protein